MIRVEVEVIYPEGGVAAIVGRAIRVREPPRGL